jgi:hypothetical protein
MKVSTSIPFKKELVELTVFFLEKNKRWTHKDS